MASQESELFAVVGLGNKGKKYEKTRHNIGARVVTAYVEELLGKQSSWQEKFSCHFQRVQHQGRDLLFVLPQKYMNESGEAIQPLLHFYKIQPQDFIVLYDELDLEPGVVRLKKGGSSAGHRGIEDVIQMIGGDDFYRIRIGIGHPRRSEREEVQRIEVSDWVLGVPKGEEHTILAAGEKKAQAALKLFLEDGLTAAQRVVHSDD